MVCVYIEVAVGEEGQWELRLCRMSLVALLEEERGGAKEGKKERS